MVQLVRALGRRGGIGLGPGASPWLAPIERAIAQLQKEAAPTAAAEVTARVAELRRRLADAAGDDAGQ